MVFWVVVRWLLGCSIVFRVFWWLLWYSGWLLGGRLGVQLPLVCSGRLLCNCLGIPGGY